MLRLSDLGAFLGAFQAQFPLVFALMQVTEVGLFGCALEWSPDPIVRCDLRAIRRECELRIGAEKGSNFLRLHLLHIGRIRFQQPDCRLELRFHLVPCKRLLRARKTRQGEQSPEHNRRCFA